MRFAVCSMVFSLLLSGTAMAQEQTAPRLYVGSGSGSTTLYNSNQNGNGAGKPLSLKQILKGKNETGYEYSREGTGFTPYGTKNMYSSGSISPSAEEVAAYRVQQAQEARKREEEAQRSLMAYNSPDPVQQQINQQTQSYMDQFLPPGTPGQPAQGYAPVKQVYEGRETGVTTPKKVFNTP
jgi:hypothetical protein